jgi:hypothetical protein
VAAAAAAAAATGAPGGGTRAAVRKAELTSRIERLRYDAEQVRKPWPNLRDEEAEKHTWPKN